MNIESALISTFGGALIGLAVTIMLLFNGRVTGISGIINSSLSKIQIGELWRYSFIAGLIAGAILVKLYNPNLLANQTNRSYVIVIVAGLLVGLGTVMGSGCTSGHGVCGISRFSKRSIVATLIFMTFGFVTVFLFNIFFGISI